ISPARRYDLGLSGAVLPACASGLHDSLNEAHTQMRIADSLSTNAVSFSSARTTPNVQSTSLFCFVRDRSCRANESDPRTGRGQDMSRKVHGFTGHRNVKTMFVFAALWSSTQRVYERQQSRNTHNTKDNRKAHCQIVFCPNDAHAEYEQKN